MPQVEVRRAPHLQDKPVGVVQYNPLGDLESFAPDDPRRHMNASNGSLIAVSYQARAYGVKRRVTASLPPLCCTLQVHHAFPAVKSAKGYLHARAGICGVTRRASCVQRRALSCNWCR